MVTGFSHNGFREVSHDAGLAGARDKFKQALEDLMQDQVFTPADSRSQPAPTTRALPPQDAAPEKLG